MTRAIYDTHEYDIGTYHVRIDMVEDCDNGPPWKQEDGHGPVSDWRPKDSKAPGEWSLIEDRG